VGLELGWKRINSAWILIKNKVWLEARLEKGWKKGWGKTHMNHNLSRPCIFPTLFPTSGIIIRVIWGKSRENENQKTLVN
jgi:hypothetical protein